MHNIANGKVFMKFTSPKLMDLLLVSDWITPYHWNCQIKYEELQLRSMGCDFLQHVFQLLVYDGEVPGLIACLS